MRKQIRILEGSTYCILTERMQPPQTFLRNLHYVLEWLIEQLDDAIYHFSKEL
jgi:hypothetical protein